MGKILHVLAQRPGQTGSGIFLNSLVEQADNAGYQQAVIAGIPGNASLDFPGITNLSIFPVHFETDELPFPVAGMSDIMPYTSTRYRDMTSEMLSLWKQAFRISIEKAISSFKPDVIITHHLWLLTAMVSEAAKEIPVLTITHGTGLRQLDLASDLSSEVVAGCRDLKTVLALNEFQKQQIHVKYGIPLERIFVTGSGYNSTIFYPPHHKDPANHLKLVYCGKLAAAKGVPNLIKSFHNILDTVEDMELILVGSGTGTESRMIRKLAEEESGKVKLLGAIPQRELGKIFRECDIFILPSFYEGLPLVILEALASGLHVVCTDLPGLKDWIGNKINNSGFIKYVKLPRLIELDKSKPEDVYEFQQELSDAILETAASLKSINNSFTAVLPEIVNHSWRNLFLKIEKLLTNQQEN